MISSSQNDKACFIASLSSAIYIFCTSDFTSFFLRLFWIVFPKSGITFLLIAKADVFDKAGASVLHRLYLDQNKKLFDKLIVKLKEDIKYQALDRESIIKDFNEIAFDYLVSPKFKAEEQKISRLQQANIELTKEDSLDEKLLEYEQSIMTK